MDTRRCRRTSASPTAGLEASLADGFGPWSDEIWETSKNEYSLIAVRDAKTLNILYPASDPRWIRLKVSHAGRVVGWAVVINVAMRGHNYFGICAWARWSIAWPWPVQRSR